jgi:copper transport protein
VILGAAWVARRAVQRRGGPPRARLRRAVATELTLAAVVLALTAVLVQTVPARNALAATGPGYEVTLGTGVCSLRVHLVPAKVGRNTVQLEAFDPDGKHIQVINWLATASLNSRGIPPVTVSLRPVSGDVAAGTVDLSTAGKWRFRFAVRVSGADPDTASVNTAINVP